ncbi:MAG: class I SAM-dependent methyltransferase, partial [Candidatus Omnitrophota bacterium]
MGWLVFFGKAFVYPVTNKRKIPQSFTGSDFFKRLDLWSLQTQRDKFLFGLKKLYFDWLKFVKIASDTMCSPKLAFFFKRLKLWYAFHNYLPPFKKPSFGFRHSSSSNYLSFILPKIFKYNCQIPAVFGLSQSKVSIIFTLQDKRRILKTGFLYFVGVNTMSGNMRNTIFAPFNFIYPQTVTSGSSIIRNTKDVKEKFKITAASPLFPDHWEPAPGLTPAQLRKVVLSPEVQVGMIKDRDFTRIEKIHFGVEGALKEKIMTLRKAQNDSQFYLLDIGAGSGGLLHSINTDKSLKLFVKTSAFEMEESERIIKQQNGIDWEFGETAENLPQSWSNKFNIVFLTYVLEYAYNPLKIIEEIYRVLALNGEAFLSLALFNKITYKRREKYFHFGSYGFDAGNIYFEGIDFWVEINQFRKRGYAIGIYVKQLSEGEYYLREVDQSLWNIFNKGVNIFPPDEKVRPEESVFLIRIKKNKPEPLIFNYEVTKVDNLIHRRFDLKRAASPISSVNDSAENSKIRTVPISIDMIFEEYNIMYIEARKVRGAASPLAKPRRAAAGSPIDSHDGGSELFPPICADSLSGVKLGDSRICLCNLKSPNQKIVLRKTSDTDYPAKYNIYLDKQCVGGLIYYNAPQMIKVKNLTISNASAKRGIGQSVMCFIADSVRESIGGDRLVGISGTTSAENIHNFCKFFKNIVYGSLDDPIPANEEELLNRLGRGALTFRGIPKSKEEIALVLQDNDKKTYSSSPVITDKAGKDIDKRGPHEL